MAANTKGLIFGSEDDGIWMGNYLKKADIDEFTNDDLEYLDDNKIYKVERTGDACDVTEVSALEYRSHIEDYILKTDQSEWENFDNEGFKSIAKEVAFDLYGLSDKHEIVEQERTPEEEAFISAVRQQKAITKALIEGNLSCLPGEDGFADTQPAINLINGSFYHGINLLVLKDHQKQNGFPTAEYVAEKQLDNIKKISDYADISIRQGEKGISIVFDKLNEETGEWEPASVKLFHVAQFNKPVAMKEWVRQEKLEYLQSQYGTNYQLPEPTQKAPGSVIGCSSTEPEKYLGQYFAAVSLGGKFKASKEQAAEFAQKLENSLSERMENGFTNPFILSRISDKANEYCKEVIKYFRTEKMKAEQDEEKEEIVKILEEAEANGEIDLSQFCIQMGTGKHPNFDRQLETAKKAAYVQGVCECVAAIGDVYAFGKKLLSEMSVTKDMAKKFANPETYKILEQGIFAPQYEQKQEQTHNIRR
jgi:hypothetical protein